MFQGTAEKQCCRQPGIPRWVARVGAPTAQEGPEGALKKRKSLPSPGSEEPSAKRSHVSGAG
jgi:hypothetical protein